MRLLWVEDDLAITLSVSKLFKQQGIVCDFCHFGEDCFERINTWNYDALLLDLNLPDIRGNQIIQKIRLASQKKCSHLPIIVITGSHDMDNKLESFVFGADDYITKPFNSSELLLRLHNIVRRCKGYSNNIIKLEEIEFDFNAKLIKINEKILKLTSKESKVFEFLLLRRGCTLSKRAILDHLYGGIKEPTQKIVDVLICKIRNKIKKLTEKDYLKTMWGQGYRIDKSSSSSEQYEVAVA